jgi:hypothetical protein
VNFTFAPAGVFWNAAISLAYAGCGVEYATKFKVSLPPGAADVAAELAAALVLAGVAAADDAAADDAAAEEGAADAAVDADVDAAADDVDAAVVDFDELHPAASSRPVAASRPKARLRGRTGVLQFV